MLPLLGLLGTILGAFEAAPKVFEAGKAIVETISGKPVAPEATPKDVVETIKALPPEQQQAALQAIQGNIELYRAETERIKIEGGEMTAELLTAVPDKKRAEVAVLRMTTRPWLARYAMHVIAAPIIVAAGDYSLMWANGIYRVISQQRAFVPFDLFAEKIMAEGSAYVLAYQWAAPTCMAIVLAFIGARATEKAGGADGLVGKLAGAVGAVKGLFGGRGK
jgi:hypothetical protein